MLLFDIYSSVRHIFTTCKLPQFPTVLRMGPLNSMFASVFRCHFLQTGIWGIGRAEIRLTQCLQVTSAVIYFANHLNLDQD